MRSIYETYCDLRDLMIDKRMFFIIWLASPVTRDQQTVNSTHSQVEDNTLYAHW